MSEHIAGVPLGTARLYLTLDVNGPRLWFRKPTFKPAKDKDFGSGEWSASGGAGEHIDLGCWRGVRQQGGLKLGRWETWPTDERGRTQITPIYFEPRRKIKVPQRVAVRTPRAKKAKRRPATRRSPAKRSPRARRR